MIRRTLPYLVAAVAIAAAALASMSPGRPASAATTFTIKAGNGEPGYAVSVFLPATVTINTGDTVHWTFPWKEPHTVTLGTPQGDPTVASANVKNAAATYDGTGYISSGLQGPEYPPGGPQSPTTFDVTFTKPGTYAYFCAIHPQMKASVTVVDSGTVSKQADLDAKATSDYSAALASLKSLASAASAAGAAVSSRADGTKQYTLAVDALSDSDKGNVQQFFPPSVNITAGDTVVWKSTVHTPHTVTFGAPPPGDPFTAGQTGGPKFSGSANSGIIGLEEPNGTSFQLTFPAAGTFQYYCMLHSNQGMTGQVIVAAAAAPPTPAPTTVATPPAPAAPRTGSGVASDQSDSAVWLIAGALIVAFGATATALYATRR